MKQYSNLCWAHASDGLCHLLEAHPSRRPGVHRHDRDLIVDGDTYGAASGYTRTAVANNASLALDNLDVEGIPDSKAITERDLRAGRFDHAEIQIFAVNWPDPAHSRLILRKGSLGEVRIARSGTCVAELRGLTQALEQWLGAPYSPECRADLGDAR